MTEKSAPGQDSQDVEVGTPPDLGRVVREQREQISKLKAAIEQKNRALSELAEVVQNQQKAMAFLQATMEDKEGSLQNFNSVVESQLSTIESLGNTLKVRDAGIRNLEGHIENLESVVSNQKGTIESLELHLNGLREKLDEALERNLYLNCRLSGASEDSGVSFVQRMQEARVQQVDTKAETLSASGTDDYFRHLFDQNPLFRHFIENRGDELLKASSYFEPYHRHLKRFRGAPELVVLEIGVQKGGSLQMWRDYFGDRASIYGIDINPECKRYEATGIQVLIGDQSDPVFLEEVSENLGPIDVIIDDGGYDCGAQIASFTQLFSHLKNGGVYLVEDVGTSYWSDFGGAFRKRDGAELSFIEFAKDLVDSVNRNAIEEIYQELLVQGIYAIHFYEYMVVFEKREIEASFSAFSPLDSSLNEKHGFSEGAKRLRSLFEKRRPD